MSVALIAGSGLHGTAAARRLAADGWFVVLGDARYDAARTAAETIGADCAAAIELDVTELSRMQTAVEQVKRLYGPVLALVNAAGGRSGADAGPFTQSDPAGWAQIVDLHLRGVLNACSAVLPGMVAAQGGGIVSVAAIEGLRGDPNAAVFSAAKAGVIVLSQMLVGETLKHGIRVNTIVPGNPQSLERSGRSDDAALVAEAVAFLLSEASAQTSGACLDVSGGWALH